MLEETVIPSIWDSISSWFTPTVLFILLNIVIGTIAVTSGFGNQKHQQHETREEEEKDHHHEQRFHHQLVRAPSNVIQRLKSINLYHFKTEDLNPFSSFPHPHEHRETQDHQPPQMQSQLARAPSSVIQRLKSINLYSFKAEDLNPFHQGHRLVDEVHDQQQPQSRLARAPSNVIQRLKSINLSNLNPFPNITTSFQQPPPPPEINHRIQKTKTPIRKQKEISPQYPDDEFDLDHHQEVLRTNSDRRPSKLAPQKNKIKKSMSAKLDFWDFGKREEDEVVVVRRPSTVKVLKETTTKASESERFGDEEVDAKADDFINKFKHQLKLQRLDSMMRYKDLLGKDGK